MNESHFYFIAPNFHDCCGWQEVEELGGLRVGNEKVRETKGMLQMKRSCYKILKGRLWVSL